MTASGDQKRPRGLEGTIWVLEHAQDYVAFVAGLIAVSRFENKQE